MVDYIYAKVATAYNFQKAVPRQSNRKPRCQALIFGSQLAQPIKLMGNRKVFGDSPFCATAIFSTGFGILNGFAKPVENF